MAHFAELDADNKVLRVLVVDNSQEHRGQEFLAVDCNLGGRWIQTSYNATIRGKYAGIGDTYDEAGDIFVAPPAPPIEDAAPAEPIIEEPPIEDPAPAE